MSQLQKRLVLVPEDDAAKLVQAFLGAYQTLCRSGQSLPEAGIVLPALFDLLVSARYAERVTNGGWVYCHGDEPQEPALFFPFMKTCPRCSVKRGNRPATRSNKPGSDAIGVIAGDAMALVLREMLRWTAPTAKIAKSADRQGDVDLVIYAQDLVALFELKSSPLAAYPLKIGLSGPLTETRTGEIVAMSDHAALDVADLRSAPLSMALPHVDLEIDLGPYGTRGWPYPALIEFVRDPRRTEQLIVAWEELYHVYETKQRSDPRRWLTYGCGGGVDDSKNAPGLDRTDDLKKGTYQVLKLGAYFKEKCARGIIRAGLASNFMPLHSYDRYLGDLHDIIWTRPRYAVALEELSSASLRAFHTDDLYHLYDAVLGLTRALFYDAQLRDYLGIDQFLGAFCQ